MKRKEILNHILGLSRSQGFYGRLYESLMETKKEDPEAYEAFMEELEAKNFSSPVDLVIYLEEGE